MDWKLCINTVQENSGILLYSKCARYHQQGHTGSKTMLQQNPFIFNWGCRSTEVNLYRGHKMVTVVVTN